MSRPVPVIEITADHLRRYQASRVELRELHRDTRSPSHRDALVDDVHRRLDLIARLGRVEAPAATKDLTQCDQLMDLAADAKWTPARSASRTLRRRAHTRVVGSSRSTR